MTSTVLVTGANRGIGLALATAYASAATRCSRAAVSRDVPLTCARSRRRAT
jgi:NAD(P)-dependent dehydrogenase (short-subunit alcohol dehydrogenase family)